MKLLQSFSVSNDTNDIVLNDATFDGNGMTLTLDPARTDSLFDSSFGGIIKNLTITTTSTFTTDAIMFKATNTNDNWVTIQNCTINGGDLSSTASMIPLNFQHSTNTTLIKDCIININQLAGSGGISADEKNITVEGCVININEIGLQSGGVFKLARINCHVTCCQVNIKNVTSDIGGGIFYTITGKISDAARCEINFENMNNHTQWGAICYGLELNGNFSLYFNDIISNISGANSFIYRLGNINGNSNIAMNNNISKGVISGNQFLQLETVSVGNVTLIIVGSYSNGAGTGYAPPTSGSYNFLSLSNFSSLAPITNTLTVPAAWTASGTSFVMRNPGLPYINCINGSNIQPPLFPCFLPGTMIQTPSGEVAIEKLNKNDLVMTNLGVKKITKKIIINATNIINRDIHPVCFTENCFYENYPSRDTWSSRFHKINYNGEMVSANDLFQRKDIVCKYIKDTYHDIVEEVTYHHLQVEDDACYFANNLIAESIGHEHLLAISA